MTENKDRSSQPCSHEKNELSPGQGLTINDNDRDVGTGTGIGIGTYP